MEVDAETVDIRNEQCKLNNRLCSLVCFSRTRSEEKQGSSTSAFLLKQAQVKKFQKDSEKLVDQSRR